MIFDVTINQGAEITTRYSTGTGNEETLKALVYQHGAVLVSVGTVNWHQYRGAIFDSCPTSSTPTHAVVVVGYGTENGVDYWLVKNSWGTGWGDQGYIKIKRGVEMCGIGRGQTTLSCEVGEINPGIDKV